LRRDYGVLDFDDWFLRKANEGLNAYVKYDNQNNIQAFLMLQIKETSEEDIIPLPIRWDDLRYQL
jgi:hypothetical protein